MNLYLAIAFILVFRSCGVSIKTDIADLETYYVLDPFDHIFNEYWFIDDQGNSDISLSTSLQDKLFGAGALRVDFDTSASSSVRFGWIQAERPHNVLKAVAISLWYKVLQPTPSASIDLSISIDVAVYDDAACIKRYREGDFGALNPHPCSLESNLDKTMAIQLEVDLRSSQMIAFEWQEIRIPLVCLSGDVRWDRIRGWSIAARANLKSGVTISASILFDQLSFVGGGELTGSFLHWISDSMQSLVDEGILLEEFFDSFTAARNSNTSLVDGVLDLDYSVQKTQVWGGFNSFAFIVPGASYLNFSKATDLVVQYRVPDPSSSPGTTTFRIILQDGSNCGIANLCDSELDEHERYYSFHDILDSTRLDGNPLTLELTASTDFPGPFWLTGWSGILGNSNMDTDYVKGFSFELVVDSQLAQGEVVQGRLVIDSFDTAIVDETGTTPTQNGSPSPASCLTSEAFPSVSPTEAHTMSPSMYPSNSPTFFSSSLPTSIPSIGTSYQPTDLLSGSPSSVFHTSSNPTAASSLVPSFHHSSTPSNVASSLLSSLPSPKPSLLQSTMPIGSPTSKSSQLPSAQTDRSHSFVPSSKPSVAPTWRISMNPSLNQFSLSPSNSPSSENSSYPNAAPSPTPSVQPSAFRFDLPTKFLAPSAWPTTSARPTTAAVPTLAASFLPSDYPSSTPTLRTSTSPSTGRSLIPSGLPSTVPSIIATSVPSAVLTRSSEFPSSRPFKSENDVFSLPSTQSPSGGVPSFADNSSVGPSSHAKSYQQLARTVGLIAGMATLDLLGNTLW